MWPSVLSGRLDPLRTAAVPAPLGLRPGRQEKRQKAKQLIAEVCLQLHGLSRLTRDEMRLVGYAEDAAAIDVCAGI